MAITNVISDWSPTPCLTSSMKASIGAMNHISQVTRLGWVRPLRVSRT